MGDAPPILVVIVGVSGEGIVAVAPVGTPPVQFAASVQFVVTFVSPKSPLALAF